MSKLLQKGYPTYARDRGGSLQKVYLYEIDKDDAKNEIPQDNGQDPQGEAGYLFASASTSPSNSPSKMMLQILYAPPDSNTRTSRRPSVGSITYEASNMTSEFPIESHPQYSTRQEEFETKGAKTFRASNPVFIRTEVKAKSRTSVSQGMLISGIMSKGAPPGLAGATSSRWLKIGRDITVDGDLMTIRDSYAYDSNSWAGEMGVL